MRSVLGATLGALVLLTLALAFQHVNDPDLPWHLRAGEEILATRAVPTTDTWSRLSLGRPWLDIHWAAQVGLALTYRAGGFVLLQGLAFGVTLAALGVALAAAGGARTTLALPAAAAALLAAQQRLDPRPDLAAHVFPALFLLLLARLGRGAAAGGAGAARTLVALALAQVAWTNLHGSFVLGPLVVAAWAGGALLGRATRGELKALGLALALVSLATLVNPRGVLAWELFSPYLRAVGSRFGLATAAPPPRIQEWLPTLSLGAARYMIGILRPYELLLLLSLAALVAARPVDLRAAAVLVLFGALSVLALRNVAPFAFVAVAVAPAILERPVGRLPSRARRALAWLVPLGTLGVTLLYAAYFLSNRVFLTRFQAGGVGPGADLDIYPARACEFLAAHDVPGQVFNSYAAGGYYIWRLAPGRMALVDGRLDLLAADQLERFTAAMRQPTLFEQMARDEGVSHVLLGGYAGRDAEALLRYLEDPAAGRQGWRLVFADGAAAVYARSGLAVAPRSSGGEADAAYTPRPHPWDEAAQRLLAPLLRRQARLPTAELNLAYLASVAGDLDQAARLYRGALAIAPDLPAAHASLGRVELARGEVEGARGELRWLEGHAPSDESLPALRQALDDLARGTAPAPPRGEVR